MGQKTKQEVIADICHAVRLQAASEALQVLRSYGAPQVYQTAIERHFDVDTKGEE